MRICIPVVDPRSIIWTLLLGMVWKFKEGLDNYYFKYLFHYHKYWNLRIDVYLQKQKINNPWFSSRGPGTNEIWCFHE